MSTRKRYNPNTAFGRRKIREQNEAWLQSLTPQQAEAWESYSSTTDEKIEPDRLGILKSVFMIFIFGFICYLLMDSKLIIHWVQRYIFFLFR